VAELARTPAQGRIGRRLADIVEEAAAVIHPYWRAGVAVETKADASPVTEADRRAEALILERLRADFAGVFIIAEEECADSGPPETAPDRFFLVDPLDGTRAFVSGSEHFTVNIALIEHGVPVAGAVATPADGKVWFTSENGARSRVAGGAERAARVRPRPEAAEALVSRTTGQSDAERLAWTHGFVRWLAVDSSLKFCLIAEGRADIYPRTGPTSEWDTAAGQAVLEAAGGRVETSDGQRLLYGKAASRFLNPPFVARAG
jgi:3'(2'), 5'-bisphosphate nucleotidase